MSFARQDARDLVVVHLGARKLDRALLHIIASGEPRHRAHAHLHIDLADGASAPYDPRPGDIVLAAVEHHLLHETAQQRLAFGVARARISPDLRQAARQADDIVIDCLDDGNRRDRLRRRCSGQRLLRSPDLPQGRLPAALQLGGNEAVVGIDAVELSLSKRRLVATAFELLLGTLRIALSAWL